MTVQTVKKSRLTRKSLKGGKSFESIERNITGYPYSNLYRGNETKTRCEQIERIKEGGRRMSEEAVEIKNVDVTSYCVLTSYQSLLNSVYNAELAYLNAKKQYEKEEVRQWLTCDNDLEFQSKKRTVKEKEMWIKDKILHLKENRDAAKANLDDIKRIYEIALKYGLEALK